MNNLDIVQINADRGIAPGDTKGAALHLRGVAAGLIACGHSVNTYSRRAAIGPFPATVHPLENLQGAAKVDVVYERYSLGHRHGLDLARSVGVPFVLEVNAPLLDEATTHRPDTVPVGAADIEDELLAAADLIVTVSTALTGWAMAKREGPVKTILNGFEPSWFPPTNRTNQVEGRIAFLGHPKPWHGANVLVDLLIDLAAFGHRPELLIIGAGKGAAEVVARAERFDIGDQVAVTGTVDPDRVSLHLATAALGIAPYPRHQPFYFCPLKIVDYLAAGLPVVTTDQGDIAELVGESGILVEAEDRGALAAAVVELLDNPERAVAMGLIGRRRAFAGMSWRQVGEQTDAALRNLAGRPMEPVAQP